VLPGTARVLLRLGYAAPAVAIVSLEERDLLTRLRSMSRASDSVLEPSMLEDPEVPSPVTWIAGRAVYLTNRSAAAILPAAEARARLRRVVDVFARGERDAALAAIVESGVSWVYAPARGPQRRDWADGLDLVLESPAGAVYRVERPRREAQAE